MKAWSEKKVFTFKTPSGTSRGILTEKHAWFIYIEQNGIVGKGECSIIPGLSPDFIDFATHETLIQNSCAQIDLLQNDLASIQHLPSIFFAFEQALLDLKNGGTGVYFQNNFTSGKHQIKINGLIWMGNFDFMAKQLSEKIDQGFDCIKVKIGAIDFDKELEILQLARKKSSKELTLRVDANGAFTPENVMEKLQHLAKHGIHSIEQPLQQGQWDQMSKICKIAPIPIALDEELIGIYERNQKIDLLETILPQYIILKPSLHGGFAGCEEWIKLAEQRNIPWWITSALESNLGLDAICQFVGNYTTTLPQGLGTGSLYTNNITSDLRIKDGMIFKSKV
jgi:o-succinylbenzoate synthase